jgi:hypothetical protein
MRSVPIEGSMMTFVVRLTRNKAGRITAVVEQVKTGLKTRVEGVEPIGRVIAEMITPRRIGEAQTRRRRAGRDDAQEDRGQAARGLTKGGAHRTVQR